MAGGCGPVERSSWSNAEKGLQASMRYLPWYAAGAAIVAAFVTHLLVPVVIRLAVYLRAVDQPGVRKLHESAVPRLGGVAIMGGLGIAAGFAALGHWTTWAARISSRELLALVAGTLLVFLLGVVDDLRGVGSGAKFLVELAAAALLVGAGWSFGVLRLPFAGGIDLGIWGPVVSLLWIVGVTNAINLIDGLDGLAAGISTIADTWIHVSYVVQDGERNRALTIVKSRGTGHSNQVRELELSDQGVTLTDVFIAQGKVLMGVARWEWEQQERAAKKRNQVATVLKRLQLQLAQAEAAARLQVVQTEMEARSSEISVLTHATGSASKLMATDREVLRKMRHADKEVGVARPRKAKVAAPKNGDGAAV